VALREIRPVGQEYLRLMTDLLQRLRLADPCGGLWEAADVQWWYTRDTHSAAHDAVVWLSEEVPTVGALFTRSSATDYGCVVVGERSYQPAWEFVRARSAELGDVTIEMEIDPADAGTIAEAKRAGFTETSDSFDEMWLDANELPQPHALPDGYSLRARSPGAGAHPMSRRNGAEIESRLRECSLYDPELDLAVYASNGEIAGYGLFWADLRTGVGMVEPMRTEEPHGGRGLAGALLREGLARLAARGCTRLKVCREASNPTSGRLYSGAGFVTHTSTTVYRRFPGT
jgi:ribosomal protein S18 acetylase RimI-like enzyme